MITLRFPNFKIAIDAGKYLDENGIDFDWVRGVGVPDTTEDMYDAMIEDDGMVLFAIPPLLRQYIIETKIKETFPFELPSSEDTVEEMRGAIRELLLALDVTLIIAGEQEVNLGVGLTIIGAKERGQKALKLGVDNTDQT